MQCAVNKFLDSPVLQMMYGGFERVFFISLRIFFVFFKSDGGGNGMIRVTSPKSTRKRVSELMDTSGKSIYKTNGHTDFQSFKFELFVKLNF